MARPMLSLRTAARWRFVCLLGISVGLVLSCSKASRVVDVPIGPVATVTVVPAVVQLDVGSTTVLQATARDANGHEVTGRAITWASSADSTAPVDAGGRVSGSAPGHAVITASADGHSGEASVQVVATGASYTLVGAGDIAQGITRPERTAELLDHIEGTVFTAGDNAYPAGTDSDYTYRYEPTWGRHKARTRPCPGNHDYDDTTRVTPYYYTYFGALAGPDSLGYYSFDLGDWHIISLNSNIPMRAGSPQEQWLRADLAATRNNECTLAIWHHPRFSSGEHGNSTKSIGCWQALMDYGAEVVVVGHEHNYQRFAPMDANGNLDPDHGIREFVVGTGGAGLSGFATPHPNTEAWNTDTNGVIQFTLSAGRYAWKFIPVAGETYSDSGSGVCHR